MKAQITFKQAVNQIYSNKLSEVKDISSEWSLFRPYQFKDSNHKIYLRIDELPTHYHTSFDIVECAKQKYGTVLHPIQVILIERCFQTTFYLLKSKGNIKSLRGFIQLKKQCQEKVDTSFLLRFFEFISRIRKEKKFKIPKINIDSIGLDENDNFKLVDFSLYFQRNQEESIQNLSNSIKEIISNFISLSDQTYPDQILPQKIKQAYGENILSVAEEAMKNEYRQDKMSQILRQAHSIIDVDVKTTLTDSFLERIDLNDDIGGIDGSRISTIQSEKQQKRRQIKKLKNLKLKIILAILFFLLLGAGYLGYLFFYKTQIVCNEGQYFDKGKNRCLTCALGCLRCLSDQQNQCYSCIGTMYKILKDYQDQVGTCSMECKGTIIRANMCVDPQF